jgi:hypothetical protein
MQWYTASGMKSASAIFGWKDFDQSRVCVGYSQGCPVRGCHCSLRTVSLGDGHLPFCADHGIRLHTRTFVYHNDPGLGDPVDARLRNFPFHPAFVGKHVLDSKHKAETRRLGYEMSEDALSWNVFVGLLDAGALRAAAEWLIGLPVPQEPQLYLWGSRIDLAGDTCDLFAPLLEVRGLLEHDIKRFLTEPDVMLVVPNTLIVCIEAKFGSGNSLANDTTVAEGEKPKNVRDLVRRYVDGNALLREARCIKQARLAAPLHSQILRNIVFASSMARRADWHVVNLVSETQWQGQVSSEEYSFVDPTDSVRGYLADDHQHRFSLPQVGGSAPSHRSPERKPLSPSRVHGEQECPLPSCIRASTKVGASRMSKPSEGARAHDPAVDPAAGGSRDRILERYGRLLSKSERIAMGVRRGLFPANYHADLRGQPIATQVRYVLDRNESLVVCSSR